MLFLGLKIAQQSKCCSKVFSLVYKEGGLPAVPKIRVKKLMV